MCVYILGENVKWADVGAENRRWIPFLGGKKVIHWLVSEERECFGRTRTNICDMEKLKVVSRDCDRHQVV